MPLSSHPTERALPAFALKCVKPLIYWACLLAAGSAMAASTVPLSRASITPADLGIIIVQGDPLSESIGAYYQSARGIPAANVVRIALPTGTDNITPAQLAAFKAQVDAALPANVQATVLTWTRPFRVQGACGMSITSAFALGYDVKYCNNVFTAAIPYFDSDTTHPWQDFGIRPAMMLGASTFNSAAALINRGVSAEATYPAGDGYMVRTTDTARSGPRWGDFSALPKQWNFAGGLNLTYVDNAKGTGTNYITSKSPVLFYFTGLTSVPDLATNHFVPGAVGDHLTSFGGIIPGQGQMVATSWLDAGTTGSYGTVEEPYAVQDKFPKASVMIDQYYRGATLIEAYWKSVRTPGQGLFLGDPLARPFTDQASSSINAGQYVLKTRSLRRSSRYTVETRSSANASWTPLGATWVDMPGPREIRVPIATDANAEVRLSGPCASALTAAWAGAAANNVQQAQGGRAQRIYFQLVAGNADPATSTCLQNIKLSVPVLPDGLTASGLTAAVFGPPESYTLKPQDQIIALLVVDIPASVAASADKTYVIPLSLTDTALGQSMQVDSLTINLTAGTSTDPVAAPAIRLRRPVDGWYWTNYPAGRASAYTLSSEVDVKPGSGIASVVYDLQATTLWDGSDPTPLHVTSTGQANSTNFSGFLSLPRIAPGVYHLKASGYDANNALVATAEGDVYSDIAATMVRDTAKSGHIAGTPGDDVIFSTGGCVATLCNKGGTDVLAGAGGKNIFVIGTIAIQPGSVPSVITDFKPGVDTVDLTSWGARMRATGRIRADNAYENGTLQVVDTPDGAQLRLAYVGVTSPGYPTYALVTLRGVSASAINLRRDTRLY